MTGMIMHARYKAPPHRLTLQTACQMAIKGANLLNAARHMAAFPPSADAGNAILEKDSQQGLKVLQDTLSSKRATRSSSAGNVSA
jgi:type IV secretion system protein VirD4